MRQSSIISIELVWKCETEISLKSFCVPKQFPVTFRMLSIFVYASYVNNFPSWHEMIKIFHWLSVNHMQLGHPPSLLGISESGVFRPKIMYKCSWKSNEKAPKQVEQGQTKRGLVEFCHKFFISSVFFCCLFFIW